MKHFFENTKRLLSYMVVFAMVLSLCTGASAPARVRAEAEDAITITSQPENITVTEGSISGSLTVAATGGALTFQWYSCEDLDGNEEAEMEGATEATFELPDDLAVGDHYYYCEVGVEDADVDTVQSDVAKVTVVEAEQEEPEQEEPEQEEPEQEEYPVAPVEEGNNVITSLDVQFDWSKL